MAWENVVHGRRDVKLTGDFNCALAVEEENEWREHSVRTPERQALRHAEVQVNVLSIALFADSSLRPELQLWMERKRDAEDGMYAVAKAWFAGLVERRKAAEKPNDA